mmetsp:Transcript_8557/g.12876  ORF Transcript_8557/g.12876 Transcript_8557/m.12876 type:complete len:294 (-) Transcript_8557:1564-2445(-)
MIPTESAGLDEPPCCLAGEKNGKRFPFFNLFLYFCEPLNQLVLDGVEEFVEGFGPLVLLGLELLDGLHVVHVLDELLRRQDAPGRVRLPREPQPEDVVAPRAEPAEDAAEPRGAGHEVALGVLRVEAVLTQVLGGVVAHKGGRVVAQVAEPGNLARGDLGERLHVLHPPPRGVVVQVLHNRGDDLAVPGVGLRVRAAEHVPQEGDGLRVPRHRARARRVVEQLAAAVQSDPQHVELARLRVQWGVVVEAALLQDVPCLGGANVLEGPAFGQVAELVVAAVGVVRNKAHVGVRL